MTDGNFARHIRRLLLFTAAAVLLMASAPVHVLAQFGAFGATGPAPSTGLFGWLLAQQAFFYRALAAMIEAAKTNGSAVWGLVGISFVYGIFHAAGPGHGKALISSYLLANEETWVRGVTLSFASAVLQSLAAITIVTIAGLFIGATAKMMGNTVRGIEATSYLLIILVGARLLWVKGKAFLATLERVRAAAEPAQADAVAGRRDRAHDHECGHSHCQHETHSALAVGHAHGPQPEELAGQGGWRRGLSAILAVGLRPCSGAIIVLVFALAQGLFWTGVASTFAMGLGTAITVAAIATLAVGAKSLAKRLAGAQPGCGTLTLRGLEVCAAGLIILFGVALLTGYMASERMGFF